MKNKNKNTRDKATQPAQATNAVSSPPCTNYEELDELQLECCAAAAVLPRNFRGVTPLAARRQWRYALDDATNRYLALYPREWNPLDRVRKSLFGLGRFLANANDAYVEHTRESARYGLNPYGPLV